MQRLYPPAFAVRALIGTVLMAGAMASTARAQAWPDVHIIGPGRGSTVHIDPKTGKLRVKIKVHNGFLPYATSISYDGGSSFEYAGPMYRYDGHTIIFSTEFTVPTGTTKDVRIAVLAIKRGKPGFTPDQYARVRVTGITIVRP